jgi:TPR repeat protein
MTGSTTPFAKTPDWRRPPQAVMASAADQKPDKSPKRDSPPTARIVTFKPKVTYPGSLSARLQSMTADADDLLTIAKFGPERPKIKAGDEARDYLRDLPKTAQAREPKAGRRAEADRLIGDLAAALQARRASHGHATDGLHAKPDSMRVAPGIRLEPVSTDLSPHAQMQALVLDFKRRQRQANVLVAGSIVTAFVLTVAGMVLLVSFARPTPLPADTPLAEQATTMTWQGPHNGSFTAPALIHEAVDRTGKGEPLLTPARADPLKDHSNLLRQAVLRKEAPPASTPHLILAQTGRQLTLGPLLPRKQARYLLLRGLPHGATLSAGSRGASGAWIVRDEDVPVLTLSIGETASGDYPLDLYVLGLDYTPQARQHFVLRVQGAAQGAVEASTSWPAALLDMAMMTLPAEHKTGLYQSSPLLARAKRLLGEGDIASARLLLRHLAERGEADAAFALARTFDAEGLAQLGGIGVAADQTRAKSWYERAAKDGNDGAAKRLKILASASH